MKSLLQIGRGFAHSVGQDSQGPFWSQFGSFFSLFFGLVCGKLFGRPLAQFWLHFGSLWATILPPKIDQKNNGLFWKVFGSILAPFFRGFSSILHFFLYLVGTFVRKAEPTNSPPLPMKSEVRALTNDPKIDPKSDQNLDKNGV